MNPFESMMMVNEQFEKVGPFDAVEFHQTAERVLNECNSLPTLLSYVKIYTAYINVMADREGLRAFEGFEKDLKRIIYQE